MRVHSIAQLLIAIPLAACGAAPPSTNAAEPGNSENVVAENAVAPVAAATAQATPTDWAGTYEGNFDGGEGSVTIKSTPGGKNYEVKTVVAGGGCSGEATGWGSPVGNKLAIEIPTGNEADGTANQLCRISLVRNGNRLAVSEAGACTELHGMSCGFVGSASLKGSAVAIGGATDAAWLVGGWVTDIAQCRGDTALIFNTDGTYGVEEENGRWNLVGQTLTYKNKGKPNTVVRIVERSPSRLKFRYADGSTLTMVKCPSDG